MTYTTDLPQEERTKVMERLEGFLPAEIFDFHAHLYQRPHFHNEAFPFLRTVKHLEVGDHHAALRRYMPFSTIHGLYFGLPHPSARRHEVNDWMFQQVRNRATEKSATLYLVSPKDDPEMVARALDKGFRGLKVYHCYASRADTMNAPVPEYAPEWMWDLLNERKGILMLHIVRSNASADDMNQKDLRRLCRRYPHVRVVLAHIARSFNYRHARAGLASLSDLDNVWLDTSAVCETEAFRAAIKHVGIQRILWGSDFPISEMRGRCVATGDDFFWLHPEVVREEHRAVTPGMTLVGIESLLSLQEVCEDEGLNASDTRQLFYGNAMRVLGGASPGEDAGPLLWKRAREVISGGTGLLSKRAEQFHPRWPSYYSRASGCEVWDLDGRRYMDFAGGIGSVLLGYHDEDVNRAVRRRLAAGTYTSLASPDEVRLAEELLILHPWAASVRYARGGGEALAIAVRIARALTGRSAVLFCGYHGWHDWYLAANLADDRALDGHLLPGLSPHGVPRELKGTTVPFLYNDFDSFERALKALDEKPAAVVMEPMRSAYPKADFVERVAARCRAAGAVFIFDEVTSGLRYGFPGAHIEMNVVPDMVVYAKALGNGFPFAAVIGKEEVMRAGERSFISSSSWTDGVGPAAAIAVLDKMQRLNVQPRLWSKGIAFQKAVSDAASRYASLQLHVGGMPVSPSLAFGDREAHRRLMPVLIEKMQKEGYLVNSTLYLMDAHGEENLAGFLESLDRTLAAMERIVSSGEFRKTADDMNPDLGFTRLA